jgi:phosphopantetheinyl transferase
MSGWLNVKAKYVDLAYQRHCLEAYMKQRYPHFSAAVHCSAWVISLDCAEYSNGKMRRTDRDQLLRTLAADFLDTRIDDICLNRDLQGCPSLSSLSKTKTCAVSMTHTKGIFAIALCNAPIGIDIEAVAGRAIEVGQTLWLTVEEQQSINLVADPLERRRVFLAIWTQKEAYLKALGVGLSRNLNSFSVETSISKSAQIYDAAFDGQASSALRFNCDNYIGTVVVMSPQMTVNVTRSCSSKLKQYGVVGMV